MKIRGKNGRFILGPQEKPKLCACGCNKFTTIYKGKARKFIIGHNTFIYNPFKGKKHNKETKMKMSLKKIGQKPWNWNKINLDSYGQLHVWVKRYKGKAKECNFCKSTIRVEWANKSHRYKHNLSDWIELCRKCHAIYDSGEFHGIARRLYG